MKTINLLLAALIITLAGSCQKDEITTAKPDHEDPNKNRIECRRCEGSWDITDTIP